MRACALGAVTRLTLDVEPAYDVRQRVFEGLGWDALLEQFDAIMASGDSVSVLTRWQSEYHLPRRDAVAAIEAVRGLGERIRPLLLVCELRTVAADGLWMSPQYGRDTLAIHFTWRRDPEAVAPVLIALEAALAPFAARPHWGKLFAADAAVIAPLYPRLDDFARLAERLDSRGAFRNEWLEQRVLVSRRAAARR